VVSQIGWHCHQFIRSIRWTAILVSLLSLLYGYLPSLLKEQDYALLYVSIGLFCLMALAVIIKRCMDWYEMSRFYTTSGPSDVQPFRESLGR